MKSVRLRSIAACTCRTTRGTAQAHGRRFDRCCIQPARKDSTCTRTETFMCDRGIFFTSFLGRFSSFFCWHVCVQGSGRAHLARMSADKRSWSGQLQRGASIGLHSIHQLCGSLTDWEEGSSEMPTGSGNQPDLSIFSHPHDSLSRVWTSRISSVGKAALDGTSAARCAACAATARNTRFLACCRANLRLHHPGRALSTVS